MTLHPELLRLLIFLVGLIAFAALNAAYLVWLERKVAGHIQRRIGPKEVGPFGLLQPLADGIKLMSKQLLVPKGVDPYLFKVAPLRNVALTAPYFHDGRIETLEEAVRQMGWLQLDLEMDDRQVGDISSFLRALTDKSREKLPE